jgi:hypothetical protein
MPSLPSGSSPFFPAAAEGVPLLPQAPDHWLQKPAMRTPPSCGRGRSAEERQSLEVVVGARRGSVVG